VLSGAGIATGVGMMTTAMAKISHDAGENYRSSNSSTIEGGNTGPAGNKADPGSSADSATREPNPRTSASPKTADEPTNAAARKQRLDEIGRDPARVGSGTADIANPQLAKIRGQIGDPKTFDPQSIRGMKGTDVENIIPQDWERASSKAGDGAVYRDPGNPGRQIRIMPGYSAGNRPDPMTHGPYAVVSQNGGKPVKIPLEGNPTLGGN
jgi:hypothetical protein